MKGERLVLKDTHLQVAGMIVPKIIEAIRNKKSRYIISIAGESGSGKSVTSLAIANQLAEQGIKAIILGQDDYFVLPPKKNTDKRQEDPDWLGPHIEVRLDLLEKNLKDAIAGKDEIVKPLVDYNADTIEMQTIDLRGVKVVIAEGTYTSLLKNVDTRIFIAKDWLSTREWRLQRNRGTETEEPFTEQILATEHKIIAGHIYLADFVIDDDNHVIDVALEK